MRVLIYVVALLAVGCKHFDQTRVLTERYSKTCAEMGAQPGTEAHINCTTAMVNGELNRRAANGAAAAAYGNALLQQAQPIYQPRQQVICRQVGTSVICQ